MITGDGELIFDQLDQAAELQRSLNEHALEVQLSKHDFNSESNLECIDCLSLIPEARRNIGGMKRCVYCQEKLER
ncbi:MAG: TraR/DksA family transcriptional regulator [Cellvibrionaceae bacterium]